MRILNKSHVMFTCSCAMVPAPVPLTIIESNIKAYENSGIDNNILTDKCRLMGTFVSCRNVPTPAGSPGGPCAMALTVWNNTSGKLSVCGSNVLTDKSSITCALGGTIKPFVPGITRSNINKGISMKAEIPTVTIASTEIVKPVKSDNTSSKTSSQTVSNQQTVNRDNQEVIPDNNDVKKENKKPEENKNEVIKAAEEKTKPEVAGDYPYALCDYKNCPDWKDCEYLKSRYDAASIDNNSTLLENNYKQTYPAEYQRYIDLQTKKNNESTEGTWTKAAHHIISGDQVFSKHPYLVKLANYYGYDVNNADNCIMLPSKHNYQGIAGVEKQANAYVAMDLMKKQWHVGGHAYSLDSDTVNQIANYLKYTHNNTEMFKDYAAALEHKINILESKYKKLSCRKKNYSEKKEKFICSMNAVSHDVANMLTAFENNYKKSYPFYVSREACMFAFNVPNRKKMIIIYPREKYKVKQIVAVKMKVTRFEKDDYKINFVNDEEHVIKDARSFINYCGNVKYFINLTDEYNLPWKVDSSREYVLSDTMIQDNISDYCKANEQKILSFIEARKDGELYYDSETKVTRQRLNDIMG